MGNSAVRILADLAVVAAKHGDLVSAIDYLSACIKELDKEASPPPPDNTAEFNDRFNVHPKAGC